MAEAAVNLVINKLVPLLNEEVKLLRGAQNDVQEIKRELESIKAFLKDADAKVAKENFESQRGRARKRDSEESIKEWVKQVQEEAYHIEDVIDEYLLHQMQLPARSGLRGCLERISLFFKRLQARHEIASDIPNIMASLQKIDERRRRYGLISSDQQGVPNSSFSTSANPPVDAFLVKEAELVGIEYSKNNLIHELLFEDSQRRVIALVGMGGVGKTTLARKVYDDARVKTHFNCQAWITVSQSFNVDELLRNLLRQFHEEERQPFLTTIESMDCITMTRVINEFLKMKRYLVVFDDVWQEDFWRHVEPALVDSDLYSRIIITTRNQNVADYCKRSSFVGILPVMPLPPDQAMELFCRKAFRFGIEESFPEELVQLASNIVKRCGGLPLAIVAIGGLLATKGKNVKEWENVLNRLGSTSMDDPEVKRTLNILSLSYDDLPYDLKPCFLYFGVFPEDYCISRKRLFEMWIAQGLIRGKQGMALEEVAMEQLSKLIHRSLVQVDGVGTSGKPKSCRVHDMVHDVILSKSQEISLHQVPITCSTTEGVARHLSICNSGAGIPERGTSSQTRSVTVLMVDSFPKPIIDTIFGQFRLLKSLNIDNAALEYLPNEVGNLLLLTHLSLRSTNVKKLPKSIGQLHNLETLDLTNSPVYELPATICRLLKLKKLMALILIQVNRTYDIRLILPAGVNVTDRFWRLQLLQRLAAVDLSKRKYSISELGRLQQLKKLVITGLKSEDGPALCSVLEKIPNLQTLSVSATRKEEALELNSMACPPPLRKLFLVGRLESLPGWISKLEHLMVLHLVWTQTIDNLHLEVLQALPNLMHLRLWNAYEGKQLHLRDGSFPKLKVLHLHYLSHLSIIKVDRLALPLLEELKIEPCPQLQIELTVGQLRSLKSPLNINWVRFFPGLGISMETPSSNQVFLVYPNADNNDRGLGVFIIGS